MSNYRHSGRHAKAPPAAKTTAAPPPKFLQDVGRKEFARLCQHMGYNPAERVALVGLSAAYELLVRAHKLIMGDTVLGDEQMASALNLWRVAQAQLSTWAKVISLPARGPAEGRVSPPPGDRPPDDFQDIPGQMTIADAVEPAA